MLLHYADVRFEDKRYDLATALEGGGEWANDKLALGDTLDFPNLPYYIDGTVMLTQVRRALFLGFMKNEHPIN